MIALMRVLSAEWLKLRRTWALRLTIAAPVFLVALVCAVEALTWNSGKPLTWVDFSDRILAIWTLFLLPLFIALVSALLASVEHANQQWKQLYALPLPRWTHHFAKFLFAFGSVLVSTALIGGGTVVGGLLLHGVHSTPGLVGAPPARRLLGAVTAIVVASLFMIALQVWISLRVGSFAQAIGMGIGGWLIALMAGPVSTVGAVLPWTLPAAATGPHGALALLCAAVGMLCILTLGGYQLSAARTAGP